MTVTEDQAKAREDLEAALYNYVDALGYDPKVYPTDEFTELMDEMEDQEVME